jgi:tetratricopeptide (TPR) repeat protein
MNALYFLLLLLVPLHALAQSTVRGLVTEQNSGNKPIAGVQIKALGSAPEVSDNEGLFRLSFASKKIGDRIFVSEISKKGYEIVNKDVVNNWVIPGDVNAKTKIVMCPEGTLARNTLKYYDISLAGLTKGYNERILQLQEQRDKALIDAKAFGEQAKVVGEQFANAQKQLEELADRFARENFDDCSEVQRQAFEAFQAGDIEKAIGILEAVNSEAEIAKAKLQKAKGARMESESREMQAQSDSIIRQNIVKLMFQADLYVSSNRYEDAEKTLETAAVADTTYFKSVSAYAKYCIKQQHYDKALRWGNAALSAARTDIQKATALEELAGVWLDLYKYPQAERALEEALAIIRDLAKADHQAYLPALANVLNNLAAMQTAARNFEKAEAYADEALAIQKELMERNPDEYGNDMARVLTNLGIIHNDLQQYAQAEENYSEALKLHRAFRESGASYSKTELAAALNNIALVQYNRKEYSLAKGNYSENLAITRELAATNPDAYRERYATGLNNMALLSSSMKQYDTSEAIEMEAIAVYEELAKKNPQRYNYFVASSMSNLATYYNESRQYEKAERICAASVTIFRELAASHPQTFPKYLIPGFLPLSLYQLGSIYCHDNEHDSAAALFAEALESTRSMPASDSVEQQSFLAYLLMEMAWDLYPAQLSRAVTYTSEAIDIYQRLWSEQQYVMPRLALCCGRMARYMLLSKRFVEAEKYARMDIAYSDNALRAQKNLAHSLLYQGRYDDARKLYEELKDETWYGQRTFKDVFLEDFDEFERDGITHPDVAKIRELLKAK